MEDLDIATITKRSIKGVMALVSRTFVIQLITFVTNFVLTIFLSPSVFGVFFVVSAAIAFLGYFSDIGLAAALVQKKEAVTDKELKTTFTIQQALVVFIVVLALVLSPFVGRFYNLDASGVLLFQALAVAFFLSSLKTIPSIILERDLRFDRLIIPQIAETIVFSAIVMTLAIQGYGVTSFTVAVLARGLIGLIVMYIIAPWKIGFAFSRKAASRLLSFGVPFQGNSILALIKDDLFIVYLGKVLPIAQVGFVGFAQKWAYMPLRLIMDNVIRITFPSFSRLQHETSLLAKGLEKSIFAACFFIFPSVAGLITLSPYLIEIVPRYSKWEPAVLSLMFFAVSAAFSSISTPLTNALNAIGKIKITLYLMIFWTAATWILTPLLIVYVGFNGVAIASAIISLSAFIVVFIVRRYVYFDPLIIKFPLFASIVTGFITYLLAPIIVVNVLGLIFMIVLASMIYFLSMMLFAKREMFLNIRLLKENLRK